MGFCRHVVVYISFLSGPGYMFYVVLVRNRFGRFWSPVKTTRVIWNGRKQFYTFIVSSILNLDTKYYANTWTGINYYTLAYFEAYDIQIDAFIDSMNIKPYINICGRIVKNGDGLTVLTINAREIYALYAPQCDIWVRKSIFN